jgi:hypothetical protein
LVFLVVSFLLTFPAISYIHSSSPPFVLHACPPHPPRLDHSNYTWRRVQVMKLFFITRLIHSCIETQFYILFHMGLTLGVCGRNTPPGCPGREG